MRYNKGLSQIVATVLIILITVAAATFIASFLVPFVKDNLESTECFNYREYFQFNEEFEYNCYESSTQSYKISVSAGKIDEDLRKEIAGFSLAFVNLQDSTNIAVLEGAFPSQIGMLSNSSANLTLPKSGEVRTYIYADNRKFDEVSVYPILKSGRECEISDNLEIRMCG